MQTPSTLFRCAVLSVSVAALAGGQAVQVDPALPAYKPAKGVTGELKALGSNTMDIEMNFWAEGFKTIYPNIKPEIVGKGSGDAPAALEAGTAHFGPMSRQMKAEEIDSFERKFHYKPTGLPTSIDMLAVYVHKDNPLASLTLPQVDAIFSKSRKGGHDKDIRTWGELGLTGEWANQPISLYGRNSESGTYGYFKEHALYKGDYKDSVKEQPGSSAVIQGVASDKYGIGYSGIGYKTADVRAVPLAAKPNAKVIEATAENAYSGAYPLSRFLYLYVNYKSGTELDPLRAEFIRYVFSKDGQAAVVKAGYYPILKPIADKALASVGLAAGTTKPTDEKPTGSDGKQR